MMKKLTAKKMNRTLALVLGLRIRNSLEDLHAGIVPGSKVGDYSDVKVVSPYGEIPWNDLSRISNAEMCDVNKNVVNIIYTLLEFQRKEGFLPAGPFMMPNGWDEPKVMTKLYNSLKRLYM